MCNREKMKTLQCLHLFISLWCLHCNVLQWRKCIRKWRNCSAKCGKFFKNFSVCLNLMPSYLNNSPDAIAAGNTGDYCPLWCNFQPMTSCKYCEYLYGPLTRVIKRRIQNFVKNLRWSVLPRMLTAFSCWLFPQNTPS